MQSSPWQQKNDLCPPCAQQDWILQTKELHNYNNYYVHGQSSMDALQWGYVEQWCRKMGRLRFLRTQNSKILF